jgi:Holliday junction resolvase RusA-like endonuclease
MYLPSGAPIRAFKAAVQKAAREKLREPIVGGVELTLAFNFARPKSHFTAKGLLKPNAPRWPGKNLGDLDNLEKGVWDSLTGIAFNDDSQIVRSSAFKGWAARDSVMIVLEEVA